jgi:hypothetical protein
MNLEKMFKTPKEKFLPMISRRCSQLRWKRVTKSISRGLTVISVVVIRLSFAAMY